QAAVLGFATDGGASVVRADPEKRQPYRRLLEKTFLADGVKVVIATKECGITRGRRKRSVAGEIVRDKGFLPTWEHMNINPEVCRFCLSCIEMTGCPGLKHVQTDYGTKMATDLSVCANDGACERVRACNSFERVIVKRKRPPRSRLPELGLYEIPEPQKRPPGDVWRCCLVGVGGMGIGVSTRILVRAGHKEGYRVLFVDKKGLAIRNGGVVSQVLYNIADQPATGIIPYGKADLLIGIDILEAARALDPTGRSRVAAPDRTAAVINTAKVPTVRGLMGQEDFDPAELEKLIREYTRADDFLARNISRICEKYLGSRQFANIMMLGFAFQKGLIPVSMHSMAWAIKDTLRTDIRKNLYAFNMGRKLVVQPDLFPGAPVRTGWRETLEDKCRCTIRRYPRGHRLADELRELAAEMVNETPQLDESLHRAIVIRLYDCMRWGGIPYARRYADQVLAVYRKDSPDHGYAATRAVLFNLAGAMLIKDAVFVAELSSSPEKYARDREKYNVNPAGGDRILYCHLWHPEIRIGRRRLTWDMTVYDWMLRILKRSRWVRKILPLWHRDEHQFLGEYEAKIAEFAWNTAVEYQGHLARLSSPRCMNCTNPRCSESGCPLGGQIPKWLQWYYQDRWKEASDALHADNNFPELTSRVCPAPCQSACKQGLNGPLTPRLGVKGGFEVRIRDIERRIADRAFAEGWVVPKPAKEKTEKRVAVVGSGPAGLAAAQQLARAGHDVVVFEKDNAPGGLLRYGIPDRRLDKGLIDRRIEQLLAEGIELRTGVEVGKDVAGQKVRAQFDAVLLATGAVRPRDLPVEGRDRPGVYFALDFLRQENCGAAGTRVSDADPVTAKGKVVAVIGGGLTGNDCVEAAVAQG
ncbi:MAG TPA: FAD-dependent oxidoreductase, partial [Phycisphaerae bacterium]|nr:FAD-dependent oxidoreductase [Phycisphaerae bacterium]